MECMKLSVHRANWKDTQKLEISACVPSPRGASKLHRVFETEDGSKQQTFSRHCIQQPLGDGRTVRFWESQHLLPLYKLLPTPRYVQNTLNSQIDSPDLSPSWPANPARPIARLHGLAPARKCCSAVLTIIPAAPRPVKHVTLDVSLVGGAFCSRFLP